MNPSLHITGIGAVSPCGWGRRALVPTALPPETMDLVGSGCAQVRRVPAPVRPLESMEQGRFRKIAPITRFAIEAAVECLGTRKFSPDGIIIVAVSSGSIGYSEKFFEPMARSATELPSPQYFPETVFNAPCSHLCAHLGHPGPSYAILGDATAAYEALGMARDWIGAGLAPECLVVAAEELSPLQLAGLARHVNVASPQNGTGGIVFSEGSGALRLGPVASSGESFPTLRVSSVECATDALGLARNVRRQVTALQEGVAVPREYFTGGNGGPFDRLETAALAPFTTEAHNPGAGLGEAFTASSIWRILLACRNSTPTLITTLGLHQRSAAALVSRQSPPTRL